jgi:SAM-dependent methyltransferase
MSPNKKPGSHATPQSLSERALQFWTAERLAKLTGGKKLLLLPTNGAELLRLMGLMNQDATISADAVSKYLQINHMLEIMRRPLDNLRRQFSPVRIVDCGSGNSYLTLLMTWLFEQEWRHPAEILGIDSNDKVIAKSQERASKLGWTNWVSFRKQTVEELWEELQARHQDAGQPTKPFRYHAVVALHACDTATDDAISLGLRTGADLIATAPCCQAELAKQWTEIASKNERNPFNVMIRSPHLRREAGALITDSMRTLLMRGSGYEVTATEFVPSAHTPKNRILIAERRGAWSREPLEEYVDLGKALGNVRIKLDGFLSPRAQEILDEIKKS